MMHSTKHCIIEVLLQKILKIDTLLGAINGKINEQEKLKH
jgi:hypothetical protein